MPPNCAEAADEVDPAESGASLRSRLAWVPSFVVGAAAGTASAVAVALLLFAGEGMLRSLTLIVAVELMSLGIGLSAPPAAEGPAVVGSLRRRWLAALVTFAAASTLTIAWTLGEGLGGGATTQAFGLAFLAALPLYACGRLLAAIATVRIGERRVEPGAMAAVGGALGVLVAGFSGLARLGAPSLLLFLLIVLSGTALLQGWILESFEQASEEAPDGGTVDAPDEASRAGLDSPDEVCRKMSDR